LKEIQADTVAVKASVDEQKERVDKVTANVDTAIGELREREQKMTDEMREIREEVNNIRDLLPKVRISLLQACSSSHRFCQMVEKSKESQTQSLAELQQELKSLKALLLSRGSASSGFSTPPPPQIPQRASIPAWQLASTPSAPSLPAATASKSYSPPVSVLQSPSSAQPSSNGKGKEGAVAEEVSAE
jgi:peroxin-14